MLVHQSNSWRRLDSVIILVAQRECWDDVHWLRGWSLDVSRHWEDFYSNHYPGRTPIYKGEYCSYNIQNLLSYL